MKNNKNTSIYKNNIYILKMLFKASKLHFPLEVLFQVSKGIIQTLIYTVLFGAVVNSLQNNTSFKDVIIYILIVGLITGAGILYQTWFLEVFLPLDNAKIQKYMLSNVYMHAADLDIQQYENPDFYDKYIRALEEATWRPLKLSTMLASLIGMVATVGYLLYIILSIDFAILFFIIVPLVSGWIIGKKKNAVNYELYLNNTNPQRRTSYINRIMYMKDYAKEVRLTNIYSRLRNNYNDSMDEIIDNEKKYDKKSTVLTLFMDFMNDKFIYVSVLMYITYKIVVTKELLIGDYLIVQNAVSSMTWRISALINSALALEQSSKFIQLLREFLETKSSSFSKNQNLVPEKEFLGIQFKDVCFSYDKNTNVLNNININIEKNKKISIVGHNGAGKSTFIKLLMGLYQPTDGEILYNGKNVSCFDMEKYRELYSTVFQDFCLYAMNIGENIVMDDFTEQDIEKIDDAVKRAGMQERIEKLQKGIYTPVTKEFDENGFVPSGGEGQKIAIARAIYSNKDLIILDEPSSALDPIAEAQINNLMVEASAGKTIIMVSHRLSSAINSDEIYLFDKGKIIEHGTHDDLMNKNGKYAAMFTMQAEKYELKV